MSIYSAIGLLGVLCYIASYTTLQLGRIEGGSLKYTVLNGTAATLVLISLYENFNLAAALIQLTWIAISIVGAIRHLVLKNNEYVR